MKVTVIRSGGIAGLSSRWEVVIEEQENQEAWLGLIQSLPWGQTPREKTMPDRYSYRIRCSRHQVTLAEQQLTGPWRELVDRVRDASR